MEDSGHVGPYIRLLVRRALLDDLANRGFLFAQESVVGQPADHEPEVAGRFQLTHDELPHFLRLARLVGPPGRARALARRPLPRGRQ